MGQNTRKGGAAARYNTRGPPSTNVFFCHLPAVTFLQAILYHVNKK